MARFSFYNPHENSSRAIVVAVETPSPACDFTTQESLSELSHLAETLNITTVGKLVQKLVAPVHSTYIGSGKLRELKHMAQSLMADFIIFDDELSPSQQSNICHAVGKSFQVIDRCSLILDIFAAHATTKEGKLQVKLAHMQYMLPRLKGMWSHLLGEQTRGGIGSRFGQGESQLEIDRRLSREKIAHVKQQLAALEIQRKVQRNIRSSSPLYKIALVGYTNAGKSTLLNRISHSSTYVKDELFATLDSTTRSITLPDTRRAVLSDTVGFIQKLPTELIDAFKSTLLDVVSADLLLCVVDVSSAHAEKEMNVVQSILNDIGAGSIPYLIVANKIDRIASNSYVYATGHEASPCVENLTPSNSCSVHTQSKELALFNSIDPTNVAYISAETRQGIEALLQMISQKLMSQETYMVLHVAYKDSSFIPLIHTYGRVVRETYDEQGTQLCVYVPHKLVERLKPFEL